MRKAFITLLNVYFLVNSFGQDYHKVDSLRQLLYTTQDDAIKGSTILWLAREYMWTRPDTCLYYTKKGLDLISDQSIRNKFDRYENFLHSFEIRMYWISATALSEQRNDSLAIRTGLKSLQLAEKSKDKYEIQGVFGHLSEVYQNIGEPEIAIDYIRKELLLDTSSESRTVWIASLGPCFYDAGKYDSALYYLNKIDPFLKLGGKYWPVPPQYLGKIYAKKSNYKMALFYYKRAMSYAEQGHFPKDLCDAYFGTSEAFKGMGLIDSALLYARQSLVIAHELSLPGQSLDASTFLSSIYESKGFIDSAFKYQKISITLKDSLFNREKIKQVQNYTFNEKLRQQEIGEERAGFQNKIKIYSLAAGLFVVLLIAAILLRNNRHKQKLNSILQTQKEEIQITLSELKSTQGQLIQREKMASLGELTAGIAHEIQNPLNFINNFSDVNIELIEEMKNEFNAGNKEEAFSIAADIKENEQKINHHGKRADVIVKGMLQHSRSSSGIKELTDVNKLADEYLRLSYHGLRSKDKTFNATLQTDFDQRLEKINIIAQDIGRVLLNLYNNAFYAATEKKKQANENYEPTVSVSTKKINGKVEIRVKDNGNGIPQKVLDKIFQPFFTTKPTGQGTGLGLSLSYDIIKAHGGELKVETKEGEGSEFKIELV
jgi:two-component system, NtrC family, sensor kinase